MANSQRDATKEAYWRKVLKRFSASRLSVREFCKREQLTESAFYAWRRTIGERDKARDSRPAFVPAVVTKAESQGSSIALELPGGGVLRFVGPSATETGNSAFLQPEFLSGEREIIGGTLQLCLCEPANITVRLLLAFTLTQMKRVRPQVVEEFREKVQLLQREHPVAHPAQDVLQRILADLDAK